MTSDPIVHYVTIGHGCCNAIQVIAHQAGSQRDLFVPMPGGHASLDSVAYDSDPAESASGTWHFRDWCPELGKDAPARSGRPESAHHLAPDRGPAAPVTSWGAVDVCLDGGDTPAVSGRGLFIGQGVLGNDPEFIDAARSAKAADPVWITDGGGFVIAVIVPAEEYHPADTCCCKNCPWNGNHEEKNRA